MDRRQLLRNFTGGIVVLAGASKEGRSGQARPAALDGEPHRLEDVPLLPCPPGKRGPRDGYFPDVIVTSHDGERARFYSDLVMGKTVVFNFMYTNCTDRCPMYTMNLVRVQRLL